MRHCVRDSGSIAHVEGACAAAVSLQHAVLVGEMQPDVLFHHAASGWIIDEPVLQGLLVSG